MHVPIPTVFDIFPHSRKQQQDNDKKKTKKHQASVIINEPATFDILCGKDKTYGKHGGNIIYRELIELSATEYLHATTKHSKMLITKQIVNTMRTQYNSRFLLHNKNKQWVEISDAQARDKTSHALRFYCNNTINNNNTKTANNNNKRRPRRVSNDDDDSGTKTTTTTMNKFSTMMNNNNIELQSNNNNDEDYLLYQRQQEILKESLQVVAECFPMDEDEDDDDGNKKETFDTLRSEDLNAIFNEPLHDNEWDTVMTMAI